MLFTPYNRSRAGPGVLGAFCRVGKTGKPAIKTSAVPEYSTPNRTHWLIRNAGSQAVANAIGVFSELESQLCILRSRALGAQHLRIGTQMGGHLAPMPLPPLQSNTLVPRAAMDKEVLIPLFSQSMTQQGSQNSDSTNSSTYSELKRQPWWMVLLHSSICLAHAKVAGASRQEN